MKLKGLGNRAYNVLFHTHTVAGIVISFALFVIFYAGAFSLFRHEILQWENPEARINSAPNFDFEKALAVVDSTYHLNWHEVTNINFPNDNNPFLGVFGTYNISDSTTQRMGAYVIPGSYKVLDNKNPTTTVGLTMYYLHHFRHIPTIGLYLSGFAGLFLLFASVTGILIHWRNLLTKFYGFIIEGKWKTIWTNAHTVLGVIGLPFQMIYAITGSFFGLLTLVLLPSVLILYNGDRSKVLDKIRIENTIKVDPKAADAEHLSFAKLLKQIEDEYPKHHVTKASLRNFGKSDAVITWRLYDEKNILSNGTITMRMANGKVIESASILPYDKTYSQSVLNLISKLHFAEFGGITMKIIYFILSMITCFMIISGVLIWRKARDTQKYTYKQRLFHHRVTKTYLAICLSMFPAFAILFTTNKLIPMNWDGRTFWVETVFFLSWLTLIIGGAFWNNYAKQNRNFLFIGGIISFAVPLSNGFLTGDWFWMVWNSYPRVAYVDIFWLMAGLLSVYLSLNVLKVSYKTDHPKEPFN